MITLFIFSATLVAATLLSEWASRSVFSAAALFWAVGALSGWLVGSFPSDLESLRMVVEVTLFAVLLVDGMKLGLRGAQASRSLAGRTLLVGLPITLGLIALAAGQLLKVPWHDALLLGAMLAPTDPVLAEAVVGREAIPLRVRNLLNVESGLNDGLTLPCFLFLLYWGAGEGDPAQLAGQAALGIFLGAVIPYFVMKLENRSRLATSEEYKAISMVSVAAFLFSLCRLVGANELLAGFTAGIVLGKVAPAFRDAFHDFGENLTELLKLGALFLFAGVTIGGGIGHHSVRDYLFVLAVLLVARPAAIWLCTVGSKLSRAERLTVAWFGPKGFATVLYALLILNTAYSDRGFIFTICGLTVTISILLHSSTDVLVASRFRDRGENS